MAAIVRAHHEKWDGSGYPFGLRGDQIPIGARILSVVDCFDALASDRQYRKALPLGQAMAVVTHEAVSYTHLVLYQNQGESAKAESEYRDALALKPDFPEALLNLGNVLNATGRKDAARDHWVRALQLKPELALGYYLT